MANGKGKPVLATPDFTDPKWQAAHKDAELTDTITNGVKLTNMPPWKGQIAPAEIDALVKCVIRGFRKSSSSASDTPEKNK
jgi:mono/diheme cytochrome c family protein